MKDLSSPIGRVLFLEQTVNDLIGQYLGVGHQSSTEMDSIGRLPIDQGLLNLHQMLMTEAMLTVMLMVEVVLHFLFHIGIPGQVIQKDPSISEMIN